MRNKTLRIFAKGILILWLLTTFYMLLQIHFVETEVTALNAISRYIASVVIAFLFSLYLLVPDKIQNSKCIYFFKQREITPMTKRLLLSIAGGIYYSIALSLGLLAAGKFVIDLPINSISDIVFTSKLCFIGGFIYSTCLFIVYFYRYRIKKPH